MESAVLFSESLLVTDPELEALLANLPLTPPIQNEAALPEAEPEPAPSYPTTYPTTYEVKDVSSLIAKTVFLKVRFGSVGNSRKVSGSDVLETDADMSLLKVSKTLLESPELEAIKKADGKMRSWLYNTCLPGDMGFLLLPVGLIDTAHAKMTEYKAERQVLVQKFVDVYPDLIASAAQKLGSLYSQNDYLSPDEIKIKFAFEWSYISFGVPGQLKGISHGLFEAEKEKQAKLMQAAVQEITDLMRYQLLEMVGHLQDKLTPTDDGKARIIRESAVKNLQEFLANFDLRNVTDDKELASVVEKAKALLSGTSASQLRNSDLLRAKLHDSMASIKQSLSGMVEDKPGRKFRLDA